MAVATQEEFIRLDDTGLTDEELFERVPQDTAAVEKITAPRYSYWHSVFRVFFRKKSNIVILVLFAVIIAFTYIYPAVMGYDRYGNIMDSTAKHLTPWAAIEKFGFSIRWIFGTGASGQSTFDSMWYGARISLSLALLCTLINFSIGIVVGAIWGFSKKVDLVMNEVRNVVSNVPGTLIISVWVLVFSPSFGTLLFAMCVTGWIGVAYSLRTQVIIIRDREYNLASRCLGSSTVRIAVKNDPRRGGRGLQRSQDRAYSESALKLGRTSVYNFKLLGLMRRDHVLDSGHMQRAQPHRRPRRLGRGRLVDRLDRDARAYHTQPEPQRVDPDRGGRGRLLGIFAI